jgi:hypothetical protein
MKGIWIANIFLFLDVTKQDMFIINEDNSNPLYYKRGNFEIINIIDGK